MAVIAVIGIAILAFWKRRKKKKGGIDLTKTSWIGYFGFRSFKSRWKKVDQTFEELRKEINDLKEKLQELQEKVSTLEKKSS